MKILLSSESYWPNNDGGATFEHRLVHQLIDAGHEVRVVVPGKSWRRYDESDGKSYIYRTASARLPLNKDYKVTYYARSQVVRALNEFKPDIIHVHTMAITGMSLVKHAKKRHIPIVATNHLMPENVLMSLPRLFMSSTWVKRRFWSTIVKFHGQFLAVSTPTKTAAKLLTDNGLNRPLFAISNGVDTDYFQPLTTQNRDEIAHFNLPANYFIYLGRVNAEKRLDMLLKSFALSSKDCPDLNLVIAGTGNRMDELKQLAKSLDIDSKTHFLGRVTESEKRALYQHAEFFAITSPAELQSIVTLEAEACGLPVVAVDNVALRELCHDGKNSFLVALDDVAACANAFVVLHNKIALRKKFGDYSRQLIVSHHSQTNTLKKYVEFYQFALKAARK